MRGELPMRPERFPKAGVHAPSGRSDEPEQEPDMIIGPNSSGRSTTDDVARPARAQRPRLAGLVRRLVCLLIAASATAYAQGGIFGHDSALRSSAASETPGPLDSIRKLLRSSDAQPRLLPPEQAFQLTVRVRDANTLVADLTPADGYYLYRDRIAFKTIEPPGVSVASVSMPKGEPKADPIFGTVEVFHHPLMAVIVLRQTDGHADQIQLHATYQGCNEPLGVCYPPIDQTVTLALSDATSTEAASATRDPGPIKLRAADSPGRNCC